MTEPAVINQWIVEIQENDDDELFINLSDDIINTTGLYQGEKLIWELLGDDTFIIRRTDEYE